MPKNGNKVNRCCSQDNNANPLNGVPLPHFTKPRAHTGTENVFPKPSKVSRVHPRNQFGDEFQLNLPEYRLTVPVPDFYSILLFCLPGCALLKFVRESHYVASAWKLKSIWRDDTRRNKNRLPSRTQLGDRPIVIIDWWHVLQSHLWPCRGGLVGRQRFTFINDTIIALRLLFNCFPGINEYLFLACNLPIPLLR